MIVVDNFTMFFADTTKDSLAFTKTLALLNDCALFVRSKQACGLLITDHLRGEEHVPRMLDVYTMWFSTVLVIVAESRSYCISTLGESAFPQIHYAIEGATPWFVHSLLRSDSAAYSSDRLPCSASVNRCVR
jgi:hypothetical protein